MQFSRRGQQLADEIRIEPGRMVADHQHGALPRKGVQPRAVAVDAVQRREDDLHEQFKGRAKQRRAGNDRRQRRQGHDQPESSGRAEQAEMPQGEQKPEQRDDAQIVERVGDGHRVAVARRPAPRADRSAARNGTLTRPLMTPRTRLGPTRCSVKPDHARASNMPACAEWHEAEAAVRMALPTHQQRASRGADADVEQGRRQSTNEVSCAGVVVQGQRTCTEQG